MIALDPSPAASNSETTHPHVQTNQLCEGDGRSAIRHAMREGRLLDFFVLVRQILQTYARLRFLARETPRGSDL